MQTDLIKEIYSLCKYQHEDYHIKCIIIEQVIEIFFKNKENTETSQDLNLLESDYSDSGYYKDISEKSRSLQSKLTPILNVLKFNEEQSSAKELLKAIEYFQTNEGKISSKAPFNAH